MDVASIKIATYAINNYYVPVLIMYVLIIMYVLLLCMYWLLCTDYDM